MSAHENARTGALSQITQTAPTEPYQMVSIAARVIYDETGADTYIPVVLTPNGIVLSLLKYFLEHATSRSLSWMEQTARVVMRFSDYIGANGLPEDDWAPVFDQFAAQRLGGTISAESQVDPSGLGWEGVGGNHADTERQQLVGFFKWAAKKLVDSGRANVSILSSLPDQALSKAALAYRRESALLGHLWDTKPSSSIRSANSDADADGQVRRNSSRATPVNGFPEDKFWELMFEGFNSGEVLELQAMLHLLLINCGGFRSSEPPHLWVQDVHPDPDNPRTAVVRIFHPSQGAAPPDMSLDGKRAMTRKAYLRKRYGLSPRNGLPRAQRSGWKGGFHDDPRQRYKEARWFPTYAGEIFLQLWNAYIPMRAALPERSPFAFVSFEGERAGFGFNRKALQKRYARACKRIGLKASTDDGTHQHGHRHAYGKRLTKAGVDREFVRRAMHHRHVDSQDAYTAPTDKEISETLSQHTERLKASTAAFQAKYSGRVEEMVARAEGASLPD